MLIGGMRVSTGEQSLDLQRDALDRAGCERIYDDVCSGRATERPGLSKALDVARKGDALTQLGENRNYGRTQWKPMTTSARSANVIQTQLSTP